MTRPGDARLWLLLSRTERAAIRLADLCARHLPGLHVVTSFFPMGMLVWMGIGRRLRLQGVEHVRALPAGSSVLIVANHRSFFDFFVVVVVLRLRAGFRHHMFFPVRSEFFYDRPLGVLVNLVAAGMSMFPPIFRHGPKRALNRWSLARCAEELTKPGTAVGVHPEGTRNKGPDPFLLMPARPGAGRIALSVPDLRVLPVFVLGLGNRILDEIARNLVAPDRHPVRLSFGPDVDLSDLRRVVNATAARSAAERCRAAIQSLAERSRAEAAEAGGGSAR